MEDAGCLAETFGYLADASLCRARQVCKSWCAAASMAGVWKTVYERMYGEHAARWAEAHEPLKLALDSDEWRMRCAIRREVAANRASGLARRRSLLFEMGRTPATSPFYVASLALDGPWLALGEHDGHVSLHDLCSGIRQWRVSFARTAPPPPLEDDAYAISALMVCAVCGCVAALAPACGTILVRSLASGELMHRIDHCELLPGVWDQLLHLKETTTARDTAESLVGLCLYSPTRLGPEAEGLGPLRLMSVASVDSPLLPLEPPALISMLWLLPALPTPTPDAHAREPQRPQLLRARDGAMSEQAGVLAEIFSPHPGSGFQVLLLELLTLQPLGQAALLLPAERASLPRRAARRAPSVVSIQRRTPTSWVRASRDRTDGLPCCCRCRPCLVSRWHPLVIRWCATDLGARDPQGTRR